MLRTTLLPGIGIPSSSALQRFIEPELKKSHQAFKLCGEVFGQVGFQATVTEKSPVVGGAAMASGPADLQRDLGARSCSRSSARCSVSATPQASGRPLRMSAFLSGDKWAYAARIVAILLGAALVHFKSLGEKSSSGTFPSILFRSFASGRRGGRPGRGRCEAAKLTRFGFVDAWVLSADHECVKESAISDIIPAATWHPSGRRYRSPR